MSGSLGGPLTFGILVELRKDPIEKGVGRHQPACSGRPQVPWHRPCRRRFRLGPPSLVVGVGLGRTP